MKSKTSPSIHPPLALALLVLCLIAAGVFYAQLSKERDVSAKNEQETHLPAGALSAEQVLQGDPSNGQAPSAKEDPFKAFLDAKARSPQAAPVSNPDPSFVPGADPFKAKLEEQRNAPHSAVSPFKN